MRWGGRVNLERPVCLGARGHRCRRSPADRVVAGAASGCCCGEPGGWAGSAAYSPCSRPRRADAGPIGMGASIEAARELDTIALATGAPSTALALARAATSAQAHRRIRLDHDNLRDPLPTGSTFFVNSRAYTGKAGSLERPMIDRRVSDPVILLRATAIDNAARRLIIEAENTKSESAASDAHEGRQLSARGAAELAAQNFPHGPATGPSAGIRHVAPGSPAAPVAAPRSGPRTGL